MPHPPLITVQYNATGWQPKLASAIHAGNHVRIRIKGSLASQVCAKIQDFTVKKLPAPPAPPIPVPFPKLHISACLLGAPALATLVLEALSIRGYNSVAATYDKKGAGTSDDEVVLMLF